MIPVSQVPAREAVHGVLPVVDKGANLARPPACLLPLTALLRPHHGGADTNPPNPCGPLPDGVAPCDDWTFTVWRDAVV